ncbi:outer membrane beta-barrel protein [Capnocytophaga gingivalis]|uniref:Outer membrane beta-barrel protein n=1 Tax=Capnocytophaga gingivalis TaxID=1017 RepID=A0ABU5Z5N8_9FLAO|nr:outer membrane beta-barrel protein [Capnocytophaga gingivalis]MEB3074220.1 outer membrane beta-barrel protein [Capnocytophaga gingivalis]
MKNIILLLFLVISATTVAQTTFRGTLINPDQKPVSDANIILMSLPDSTLVKGAISNGHGSFELPNPTNSKKVLIKITHLEYQEEVLSPTSSNLGTIVLIPTSNELDAVVITARRRPILEQKGTRISTNVAQSTLQKLPNTDMLLNFLPGVSTSYTGGGFEVFGKGNPIFYINNRRVRNLDEVYQLSPKDIERIEMETQPGAAFDNTVGAVIYIILKKKPGDGLSGAAENTFYFFKKGIMDETWLSLNYRKGKTDWFTSISNDNHFNQEDYNVAQDLQVFTQNNQWRVLNDETHQNQHKNIKTKIGFAHEFSEEHSLGMSIRGSIIPFSGHNFSTQETTTYKNQLLTAQGRNEYDQFEQDKKLSVNAYYEGKLTDVLKMQTDVDYIGLRSDNTSDIVEHNLLNTTSRNVHTHSDVISDWWGLKTTFFQQLGKGTLGYGVEVSNLHRTENYQDNVLSAFNAKNNETRSDAFLSFSYPIKKVNLKLGTRYEYADFDYYENEQKSEAKSKTYRDWLPNVSVAFPWEKTQITFSYARKIKRPAFHDLSDYNSYVSSFLYNRGNPYITPQLTDEWNTLATYGPVSASVTYSHIHKGIYADYQLSSINSDAVERILRNYDDFSLLKSTLNAQKQIGKWMPKLTLSYEKPFADKVFYQSEGFFSVEWMNQITPSENWLFLIMLLYKSKGSMQEAYIYKPVSGVFVGAVRTFFHQSLSVYAVASDFYNGLNRHARIQNPYISNSTAHNNSNFSFKIGVSYNFNTTQNKYKGKEISEEENSRM